MIPFPFRNRFSRRHLAVCLLAASLLAVPTSFAAPADADDGGGWLGLASVADLIDSLDHWFTSLSAPSQGEVPAADDAAPLEGGDPSLSVTTSEDPRGDDKDVGPSLDPVG